MKGRRVPEAYVFAAGELRAAFDESFEWSQGRFGETPIDQARGAVGAAYAFGMESIRCHDDLPLLLSRLDEPGVRDRCVEDWSAVPPEQHDPVTRGFLVDEPGSLKYMVLRVTPEGFIPDEELRKQVRPLKRLPMDDSINEYPPRHCETYIWSFAPRQDAMVIVNDEGRATLGRPEAARHANRLAFPTSVVAVQRLHPLRATNEAR